MTNVIFISNNITDKIDLIYAAIIYTAQIALENNKLNLTSNNTNFIMRR